MQIDMHPDRIVAPIFVVIFDDTAIVREAGPHHEQTGVPGFTPSASAANFTSAHGRMSTRLRATFRS